jgi:hypothetical protein
VRPFRDHFADSKSGLAAEQNDQVRSPALDARCVDEMFVSLEVVERCLFSNDGQHLDRAWHVVDPLPLDCAARRRCVDEVSVVMLLKHLQGRDSRSAHSGVVAIDFRVF